MPLVQCTTNASMTDDQRGVLAVALSKAVSEIIGKPEDYVMVTLQPGTVSMAGEVEPAAMVDVRSIGGLSAELNRRLSERICGLIEDQAGVPANRTYLNFTDVPRSHWGWDRSTFG